MRKAKARSGEEIRGEFRGDQGGRVLRKPETKASKGIAATVSRMNQPRR